MGSSEQQQLKPMPDPPRPRCTLFGARLPALVILCVLFASSHQAQAWGTWTWVAGDKIPFGAGSYGTLRVPNATNYPPSRTSHATFHLKSKQEVWIFGGISNGAQYNDLWRYRMSENTWTWMSGSNTINQAAVWGTMGVPSPTNVPAARGSATAWNVKDEELWILAGTGTSGTLGDLWRYRISDGMWTWMNGTTATFVVGVYGSMGVASPANWPSCRAFSAGWYDPTEHALWLHAGFCKSASGNGWCGETWRYRIDEGIWAWMTGGNTRGYGPSYGTYRVASTANTPGTRGYHTGWFDPDTREYWCYGGNNGNYFGDVWRFRLNDTTWTWMSGKATLNLYGNYGPQGVANETYYPGCRQSASVYYDEATKDAWLYGGKGYTSTPSPVGQSNELWRFSTKNLTWTWLSGVAASNQNGSYGTLGTPDAANMPGSRENPSLWYDQSSRRLTLFGGMAWPDPVSFTFAEMNDMWYGDFPSGPGGTTSSPVQPAPTPVAAPDPTLRVTITSTSLIRPNSSVICDGFIEYLKIFPSNLNCIPELPAGNNPSTTFYLLLTMIGQPGMTAFNELQTNSSFQTDFLATIGSSTGGAYTGLTLEFNPSIGRACLFPQPPDALCDSSRGVWVIESSVTVTSSTPYTFISPTEVRGDFVSSPGSTVILSYQTTSLTITGCAKFEGTLILSGPPLVVSTNSTFVLARFASLCPTSIGEPQAKFSTVNWESSPLPERSCQTVSTTPEYSSTTLSVLVDLDSSGCESDGVAGLSTGATAGIAVGVIALVAVIIVAIIVYRKVFKPKSGLDQEELALVADDNNLTAGAATTSSPSVSGKSKKGKKKGETEYAPIDLDKFNAERDEGAAQIVSIPASDVKMLQRLGTGAYGDVWLGSMPDGAFVAVKRMKNSVLASRAAAFFSEASIMMQVMDNPHVVQMFGMIADGGEYGLVMEFMPGGSLETYLGQLKPKLPADASPPAEPTLLVRTEARLYDFAYSIAAGLSCLASNGIVHRDLSARNILLDETKSFAKISDFGFSRKLDEASKAGKTVSTFGPIRWMSPENIRNQTYSEKSDVWSFGCTLIEVLTGELPFYSFSGGLSELAIAIRDNEASPLTYLEQDIKARRLECPKWCTDLLKRCFARNPEDRASFEEILDSLKRDKQDLYIALMDRLDNREAILNQLPSSTTNESDPATPPASAALFAPPSSSSSSTGGKGDRSSKRGSAKMRGSVRLNRDVIGGQISKAVDSPVHLMCRLGEGSFGAVFLASLGGSYIAVKQLSLPDSANVGASERAKAEGLIYSEAAIMAKLKQNRNVIAIYGLAVEGEKISILMEFAARGSLEAFVRRHQGKIPETLVFRWAIGMARGMSGLAAHKIIHRDLAARNVLLDSMFEPKISDFGLSRDIESEETEGKTVSHVGPIRWMGPECLRQVYSEKSDVWSYGCVLVEILSGVVPFSTIDLHDIVVGVRDNLWTPINVHDAVQAAKCDLSWMKSAPNYLIKLIEMCFEKDPAKRPTFARIVQYLEENIPAHVASVEARRAKQREKRAKLLEALDQIVV